MHTLHCARNITLCEICDEPIPKREFEEHKKQCPISKEEENTTLSNNLPNATNDISNIPNLKPTLPESTNCSLNSNKKEKVFFCFFLKTLL